MISRALEAEILRLYHAEGWPIGTIARNCTCITARCAACCGKAASRRCARRRTSKLEPTCRSSRRPSRGIRSCVRVGCIGWCASAATWAARITSGTWSPDGDRGRRRKRICACAHLPAEQAQIDWAHFGKLTDRTRAAAADGLRDGALLLAAPVRAFLLERGTGSFLDAHVQAFAYFKAVPRSALR